MADQIRADDQRRRDDYNRRIQSQFLSQQPARDVGPGEQVFRVALILAIAITIIILNVL
ncbi:hypothetical protein AB0K68_36175 [Streptomyces sp. NPDC050698]